MNDVQIPTEYQNLNFIRRDIKWKIYFCFVFDESGEVVHVQKGNMTLRHSCAHLHMKL